MPDVTHDTPDPPSPMPSGIPLQHAGRPEPSDKGKLRVFISYARADLDFANQLDAALGTYGFECVIDRHGIAGGEDWKRRLSSLVSDADTIVFVLSPTSARSEICAWEVKEATGLKKRILPVICRPLEGTNPPPLLQSLNYIFFFADPQVPGSGFGSGLRDLIAALNTDFDWLREHTRYLQRAMEWKAGGQAANRLLSGDDIRDAKAWVAGRPKSAPEPTTLQLDFIRASEEEADARSSAQRQQLEMMAAAQSEREMALHEREEALKEVAKAQRRRATIRNIALVAVTTFAVVAGLLYWRAEEQRKMADEQRKVAEDRTAQTTHILLSSTNIIIKMYPHLDSETKREVFAVFETGAASGNASSMRNLAISYDYGIGVEQDYPKARQWYEKAADLGDAHAMRNLGLLYQKGNGMEQDHAKARQWYEKAADKGDADAMRYLAVFYENGRGVVQDYAKARQWYEKAADKGDVDAMRGLGVLYQLGHGAEQDYAKARQWYEKAIDKGDGEAMRNLGLLYEFGYGMEQDYAKARQWYEKAGDKGIAMAMHNLGLLFQRGDGVEKDYAKARQWYEKAAAKGDDTALREIGLLYANGIGVERDYVEARQWYELAAKSGDEVAMRYLGTLYQRGNGVERDFAKAHQWYDKAADKGDTGARVLLQRLPISQEAESGRYIDALKLQQILTAEVETEETKRAGKPGQQTASEVTTSAWYALLARDFATALALSDRAHALAPDYLQAEINRAHALMYLGRKSECEALYLTHKGKIAGHELWERIVAADFKELRKAGLEHAMMAEIEMKLGVTR